jgi:c-di-GMP-binding flagellar brake protein YcgR
VGIERRRHERIDIALEVRVRHKDNNGALTEESTLSGNISLSGCSLLIAREVATGSEVEMEFIRRVPGQEEPVSLSFRGTVVRSTRINRAQYVLGIEFLNDRFPISVLG